MSRLDQAFIKAYAKDSTTVPGASTPPLGSSMQSPTPQATPYGTSDALSPSDSYASGSWYRIETPASRVPAPHADFSQRSDDSAYEPPAPVPETVVPTASEPSTPEPVASLTDQPPEPEVPVAPAIWQSENVSVVSSMVLPPTMTTPVAPPENIPAAVESSVPPASSVEQEEETTETVDTTEQAAVTDDIPETEAPVPSQPEETLESEQVEPEPEAAEQIKTDTASPSEPDEPTVQAEPEEQIIEPREKKISLEIPVSENRAFRPAWEVSSFQWPEECCCLLEEHPMIFSEASERLLDGAKAGRNVVGITGTMRGEGRTTLALCLAQWSARSGARVALIDADLNNPQLGYQLGLQDMPGWTEAGENPSLKETAIASVTDRITLVPLGNKPENIASADYQISNILRQAARLYDLVLVDLGVLSNEGQELFDISNLRCIDAAVVTCDLRHTNDEQIEAAVGHLYQAGVRDIMLAETFAPHQAQAATLSKAA